MKNLCQSEPLLRRVTFCFLLPARRFPVPISRTILRSCPTSPSTMPRAGDLVPRGSRADTWHFGTPGSKGGYHFRTSRSFLPRALNLPAALNRRWQRRGDVLRTRREMPEEPAKRQCIVRGSAVLFYIDDFDHFCKSLDRNAAGIKRS